MSLVLRMIGLGWPAGLTGGAGAAAVPATVAGAAAGASCALASAGWAAGASCALASAGWAAGAGAAAGAALAAGSAPAFGPPSPASAIGGGPAGSEGGPEERGDGLRGGAGHGWLLVRLIRAATAAVICASVRLRDSQA